MFIIEKCEELDANGIARTGVRSFNVKFAGIYYFDIYDGDNVSTLTIVATSVQKDHKITITDTEAKPKILGLRCLLNFLESQRNILFLFFFCEIFLILFSIKFVFSILEIYPEDRVWFSWDETRYCAVLLFQIKIFEKNMNLT